MAKNDNAKGGAKGGKGAPGAKGGAKPAGKGAAPQGGKTAKAAKGGEKRGPLQPKGHAGTGLPVSTPRLKLYYEQTVRGRLAQQFGLENPHQVPGLEKVVINCGVGEAIKQPRVLDTVVDELALISGQRPVRRKAKKSIANFGLREGQEIGAMVTLRGARMWEFVDRLIAVAIPRIRDFRGLKPTSFDGRGNYSLGVREQIIFPEIDYDSVDTVRGLDVTITTSAPTDAEAYALLEAFGMPFSREGNPFVRSETEEQSQNGESA